jgi:hypothetical protein
MNIDKRNLSAWLKTIDPTKRWEVNNLQKLEKQLVANIKECGYLNLNGLLTALSSPTPWEAGEEFGDSLKEQILEEARTLPDDDGYREEWASGLHAVLDGVTSWALKTVESEEEGGF